MRNMLFEIYKGNDISYVYTTSEPVNGVYIWNFDKTNSLSFAVNGISYPLEPGQGFRSGFSVSFSSIVIDNPSGCNFLIAGLV